MANQGPGNENVMMEDIFQAINASDKAESPPLHLVTSISPNDWVMALNNDILNKSGKNRLAEASKHNPAFYHVAFRLLEQTSLGIALAREILEDDNWSKYQEICEEYNIKDADTKEKMINALGRFLVSKKLVFWS